MAAILVFGTSKISCVCLSKNPDSSLIDVYSLGGLSKMETLSGQQVSLRHKFTANVMVLLEVCWDCVH